MERDSRIFVAGHRGLAGSAICRRLAAAGYSNLILRDRWQLDLREARAVADFFAAEQPEYVFLAAAKVGGILANSSRPAEFIHDNLAIQTNTIEAARRHGVKKFLFLGSSCIYPKFAPQPIREDSLLSGPLEPTNEWYAVAKIAGIKMAQAYRAQYGFRAISLMPTNLYGPQDNFDLATSHVLPALIRKFHAAKMAGDPEVVIWGTGSPRREFLHVDDLADTALHLMLHYDDPEIINVGTGEDITIRELAELVASIVGFQGGLRFDPSKPDGTPRKLLDVTRLHSLGWRARIPLRQGIAETYQWFQSHALESVVK
ncbi:MAG TPA: GDP-L-fucose synthase [Bryobacteraceae bacterium]|nr:GDP-L-fucose synthase [Bryobacteraceae bacterium]